MTMDGLPEKPHRLYEPMKKRTAHGKLIVMKELMRAGNHAPLPCTLEIHPTARP